MTLNEEAKQIRAEVSALNPGRGRKYPKAFRERVLRWMERAQEEGLLQSEAVTAIGVSPVRIEAWRVAERHLMETYVPPPIAPRATANTALVPITIRDALDRQRCCVHSRNLGSAHAFRRRRSDSARQ